MRTLLLRCAASWSNRLRLETLAHGLRRASLLGWLRPLHRTLFWRPPALACGLGLFGSLTSCQCAYIPSAYLHRATPSPRRVVITMDHTMRVTREVAFFDSLRLIESVAHRILQAPDHTLTVLVYFNGVGPLDYAHANSASFRVKDRLVGHGYEAARIHCAFQFYVPTGAERAAPRYPYTKVDFIDVPPSKGRNRQSTP